jgi:hypothetical protein
MNWYLHFQLKCLHHQNFLIILVEVFVSGGGITFRLQEYLHQFSITFEHKRGCGGDGGDGGDIFLLSLCPKVIA